MYRTPDATPRCPSCHGTNLTPTTFFDPSQAYVNVHFRRKNVTPDSRSGADNERYRVTRARVCLSCGAVAWFLDREVLAKLRVDLPGLEAYPDT